LSYLHGTEMLECMGGADGYSIVPTKLFIMYFSNLTSHVSVSSLVTRFLGHIAVTCKIFDEESQRCSGDVIDLNIRPASRIQVYIWWGSPDTNDTISAFHGGTCER